MVGQASQGQNRVVRGGSWINNAQNVRSAYRSNYSPDNRNNNIGFRCAQAQERAGWLGIEQTHVLSALTGGKKQVAPGVLVAFSGCLAKPRRSAFFFCEFVVSTAPSILKRIHHPLVLGCPPAWASAWGQDEYGIFAEFTVEGHGQNVEPVTQRMRWIPPGRFDMGEENDTHEVTLSKSIWIFDTPCTQALWSTVMENPSRFVDPDRPVEQVSWDDAQKFVEKLNEIAGLSLRLPTEAEWEYCCRAGTATATYVGDVEILGQNNAPDLDAIAWYGGNCGVEFDLEDGVPAEWSDKQYEFDHGGTRKVAVKQANKWGLYDMLGNVWEWCQDWYGEYSSSPETDPKGPPEGLPRVVRGGSWFSLARIVRSAYRYNRSPGIRYDRIGFRCAQVHSFSKSVSKRSGGLGVATEEQP